MKEYYYLIMDCGDGSCYVNWFKHKENAEKAKESSTDYWASEIVETVLADNLDVEFQDV